MKVASLNLRNAAANDGENSWPNRRQRCLQAIRDIGADIIGMQEAMPSQVNDLKEAFPELIHIGVGRLDGIDQGEYCAIMVKPTLKVLASGTFWLSESPFTPGSMSWNTACTRIATWVQLQTEHGPALFVNTHWDHESEQARLESGRLTADFLSAYDPAGWRPGSPSEHVCPEAILLGDFNCEPESPALMELPLFDARVALGLPKPVTFQGFGNERPQCIDHVFLGSAWQPVSMEVPQFDPYISDHNPVIVELVPAPRS